MHILHPGISNVTCLIDIKNANFKKRKKTQKNCMKKSPVDSQPSKVEITLQFYGLLYGDPHH